MLTTNTINLKFLKLLVRTVIKEKGNKNIIRAFCVYVEIVIRLASTIRRAGLIAFVTVHEKSLDFADAEA